MSESDTSFVRPIPSWVRALGIATIVAMVPLVALGGQTTTRQAGMADPVWPTQPLYIVFNSHVFYEEPQAGFLLEHTHRFAGWITGFLSLGFAFAAWRFEPNRRLKIAALVSLGLLVLAYGGFHGVMGMIRRSPQDFGPLQAAGGITSALAALAVIGVSIAAARTGTPGGWTRALATIGLVGVMVQGLLGGLRVSLNYWFGTNLAVLHGCFAQIVFCTYVAPLMSASVVVKSQLLDDVARKRLGKWVLWATAIVALQLVWGALTRHYGSALAQRLHMLTAFAATILVVVVAMLIFTCESTNRLLRGKAIHLIGNVIVQVLLGVEAYVGKFATVGPQAFRLPMDRDISTGQALTRTAHVLVGLTLLASLVALAVRVYRTRATTEFVKQSEPGTVRRSESDVHDPAAV